MAVEKGNINTATREELAKIPFMSTERAEMVIHNREANGPFTSVEQLVSRVTGINERLAERVAEYFDFGDAAGEKTVSHPKKKQTNEPA